MKFQLLTLFISLSSSGALLAAENPFIGRWALTLPGGGAGWLGVDAQDGKISTTILWGGGSVVPVTTSTLDGETLVLTRHFQNKDKPATVETITAKVHGDELLLTTQKQPAAEPDSKPFDQAEFTGKRIPDLPPAPDLTKVKFGKPIPLINGKDLSGWQLMGKGQLNGWSVVDGVLQNRMVKEDGKRFGNLRTDAEFEDFNLKTEVRTLPESNSGIYLRGIYEIQIKESFGKPLDSHNMGALYSRITPSVNAEKPIGEWQTLDITLVDRHLTVILNDKTIIDNAPVLGVTGGAMTSDEFKPGPIYLQGDHTDVDYRNMILRPVER
jgi:Domain of Unknown Function (DUF1080)